MAGRRQHYIPRFLQRGFLDVSESQADRTWLYRNGTKPRLVGIRDVGIGEYFYSKLSSDGEQSLDDLITELESDVDRYITTIRSLPIETAVDANTAACLVAHLAIRTKHVRSTFAQGFEQIINEMTPLLSDSAKMRELMGIDKIDSSANSTTPVRRAFDGLPLEKYSLAPNLSKRILSFYVRELFDDLFKGIQTELSQKVNEIADGIVTITRDAHNKALMNVNRSSWEQKLSELSWRVLGVSGAILPDCVALVSESNGTLIPLLLSSPHKIILVFFPIAHNRILIGSSNADTSIDIADFNLAAAECSDDFFISHQDSDCAKLSHLIGTRCASAINAIVAESMYDWSRYSSTTSFAIQQSTIKKEFFGPTSYSLTCIGFADSDIFLKLENTIKIILYELGRTMPLDSIDGFTFASNYISVLKNLDRGDVNMVPDHSQPRGYGRAVAKCVKVKREGEYRNHIVLDGVVAISLLSDDENDRASSIHVIINMLSHIAHGTLYEAKLNNDQYVPDQLESLLHEAISCAPGSYYSAMQSAFCDANAGCIYADLLCDSIKVAHEVVLPARLKYRVNSDLDSLLKIAASQVSFIIAHAAQWIGHRNGETYQENSSDMKLMAVLKGFGLDSWIFLLERDLRCLYNAEEQFNRENIFALTKHAERLLWTFQIFPWLMEDGFVYVDVPMGSDADLLN